MNKYNTLIPFKIYLESRDFYHPLYRNSGTNLTVYYNITSVLLILAPGQDSKAVDCHSYLSDNGSWQTHIYILVPTFITWCFILFKPDFSVGFKPSFQKLIGRRNSWHLLYFCWSPSKVVPNVKTLKTRTTLTDHKKINKLLNKRYCCMDALLGR